MMNVYRKNTIILFLFFCLFQNLLYAQQTPSAIKNFEIKFTSAGNYTVSINHKKRTVLLKNDIVVIHSSPKNGRPDSITVTRYYSGKREIIFPLKGIDTAAFCNISIDSVNPRVEKQIERRIRDSLEASSILNIDATMVLVKGGTFMMGISDTSGIEAADDERPQHKVVLHSFYISKFIVTQALWMAVMDTNPSVHKNCYLCPVENISYNDVQKFIAKLNTITHEHYRLPAEAEWEYAAKGGNKSKGYVYSGSNDAGAVAWFHVQSSEPVGLKKPNELGLYDMSGNMNEFCSDWYGAYTPNTAYYPTGPKHGTGKVVRGGCWSNHADENYVTRRGSVPVSLKDYSLGFRLAKDAK